METLLSMKLNIGGGDNGLYNYNDKLCFPDGSSMNLKDVVGEKKRKLSTFKNILSLLPDKTPITFEVEGQKKSTHFDGQMGLCESGVEKVQVNLKPHLPDFLYLGESEKVENIRRRNKTPYGEITLPRWKITFLLDKVNMGQYKTSQHPVKFGEGSVGDNYVLFKKHIVEINRRLGYEVENISGNGMTCGVWVSRKKMRSVGEKRKRSD